MVIKYKGAVTGRPHGTIILHPEDGYFQFTKALDDGTALIVTVNDQGIFVARPLAEECMSEMRWSEFE